MKKALVLIATSSVILFNSFAFADNAQVSSQAHPCKVIAEACKAAGYVRNDKMQGKNIWSNCMKPVLDGQAVNGVNVDPATAQSCKAMKAKM